MKALKFYTVAIALFMFTNLAFGGNPTTTAKEMLKKLSKDITLTDSQKVVIENKLEKFAKKSEDANSLSTKVEKTELKKQAYDEYKEVLDSILTAEQKEQLALKQKERMEAAIKKDKTFKK